MKVHFVAAMTAVFETVTVRTYVNDHLSVPYAFVRLATRPAMTPTTRNVLTLMSAALKLHAVKSVSTLTVAFIVFVKLAREINNFKNKIFICI